MPKLSYVHNSSIFRSVQTTGPEPIDRFTRVEVGDM